MRYSFQQNESTLKGVFFMKGYTVDCGYMGYLDGRYFLFADESVYREAYWENLHG